MIVLIALMLVATTVDFQSAGIAWTAPPPKTEKGNKKMITREQAIEIATKYIAGKVHISADSTLEVKETDKTFIVEWRRHLTTPGPDFDAGVTVDKETGKVVGFLVDG